MNLEISPQPPRVGAAKVAVYLADAHNTPLSGAHLKLEGDMSHPGMAPVFDDLTEGQPGRYDGRVRFSMPGDWVVTVSGTLADGERVERAVRVPGVHPQ